MSDSKLIYLDHAAATPLDERVEMTMQFFLREQFFNPSSPYAAAVAVRHQFEQARHRLAVAIGGKADEIIITAGATESIALAMTAAGEGHVVASSIEHDAVIANARTHEHTFVPVDLSGRVKPSDIEKAIQPTTTLVSVALANNELGTIQPIREIAEIIMRTRRDRLEEGMRTPLWLHTDASQGVGLVDISLARLGVDMMTLNAGKIYGPKQVGLLWRRGTIELMPIIRGGGQEAGLRSGTENVAGAVGFAEALELANTHRKSEVERLSQLRNTMEQSLHAQFPQMSINGNVKKRLANYLHISFPGIDAERLIFKLETKGVMVATGSACSANRHTGSHTLKAIGMQEELRNGSLRLSFGRLNTQENTQEAVRYIMEAVQEEYARIGND